LHLGDEDNEDEPSLLHTYCELMSEVNRLRREERELGLQAQELETEDSLARHETIGVNGNYKLIYIYIAYNICSLIFVEY